MFAFEEPSIKLYKIVAQNSKLWIMHDYATFFRDVKWYAGTVSARVGFTADLAAVTVLLTRLTLQGVTWEYAGNSSAIDPKRETPERRDTGY